MWGIDTRNHNKNHPNPNKNRKIPWAAPASIDGAHWQYPALGHSVVLLRHWRKVNGLWSV